MSVDFAAVGNVAIAISPACVTNANGADTQGAFGGRMRNRALVAASAAVIGVAVLVGLATVGSVLIAVTEGWLAIGDAALARNTSGRSVGSVGANSGTGAAVVDALRGIDFATVDYIAIAIHETGGASNTALTCGAGSSAVGAITGFRAGAAVFGVGLET